MMIQPRPGENMGDTREGGVDDSTTDSSIKGTIQATVQTEVPNASSDLTNIVPTADSGVPGISGEIPGANLVENLTEDEDQSNGRASQNVFELNPRKVYSILEVDRILPIVKRITQEYVEKVQVLMARFESAKGRHDHKLPQIEREINEAVQHWQSKLEKLGLKTKGLWIADFDSGDGYFCWKYPEEKVNFWHQYHDGFGGRVKIDREKLIQSPANQQSKEKSPDLSL